MLKLGEHSLNVKQNWFRTCLQCSQNILHQCSRCVIWDITRTFMCPVRRIFPQRPTKNTQDKDAIVLTIQDINVLDKLHGNVERTFMCISCQDVNLMVSKKHCPKKVCFIKHHTLLLLSSTSRPWLVNRWFITSYKFRDTHTQWCSFI